MCSYMFICQSPQIQVLHILTNSYNYRLIKIGKELQDHQVQHLTEHHPVNYAIAQNATCSPFLSTSRDGDSPISWADQYPIHKRVCWFALSYYIQFKTSVSAGYVYMCGTAGGFVFTFFFFPTAVDKLLKQGGRGKKGTKDGKDV